MKEVNLVHIYPAEMNIYGDTGNRIVLEKRLAWRGFKPLVHMVGVGQKLPVQTDIILGGGGQDSGQSLVIDDLAKKKKQLKAMAQDGVSMLMICGMYQLFGHYFLTNDEQKLPGIAVFDLVTKGSGQRLIGNITTMSDFGPIIGYENHSGLTELAYGQKPLAKCPKGQGNNGTDKTEGAITNNVLGSYLHGPIVAKNPHLADEIIGRALTRKYGLNKLQPLDDKIEQLAADRAKKRPR